MGESIPLSVPVLGEPEARNLQRCIDENWVAKGGPFTAEFEEGFAAILGVPAAVSAISGSAALHLALVDLGIGPGDEVIVPALTFAATALPVRQVGAVPVFADSDPETYGLDPASAADAVTARTRAVLPVHLYGHPADIEGLRGLDLPIVEDATEALGSYTGGRPCGTLGTIGAFSFNGNKVITCGGGGMLVADSVERLAHLRHLTLQARVPGTIEFLHDELGFNYALSNLHAAVGAAQLERLPAFLAERRRIAERYRAALADVADLDFRWEQPGTTANFWLSTVLVDERVAGRTRESLLDGLTSAGVGARPFFHPLNRVEAFADPDHRPTPVADDLHARGICLPSSPGLTEADQDRVLALLGGD